VIYAGFAQAWPRMEGTGAFGKRMNELPRFVVSTTLEHPEWNSPEVPRGDLAEEPGKLQERCSGDVLLAGSMQLVRSLFALDPVDELQLMLLPVMPGGGTRVSSPRGRR
jgi:dihydrofolate reductase